MSWKTCRRQGRTEAWCCTEAFLRSTLKVFQTSGIEWLKFKTHQLREIYISSNACFRAVIKHLRNHATYVTTSGNIMATDPTPANIATAPLLKQVTWSDIFRVCTKTHHQNMINKVMNKCWESEKIWAF